MVLPSTIKQTIISTLLIHDRSLSKNHQSPYWETPMPNWTELMHRTTIIHELPSYKPFENITIPRGSIQNQCYTIEEPYAPLSQTPGPTPTFKILDPKSTLTMMSLKRWSKEEEEDDCSSAKRMRLALAQTEKTPEGGSGKTGRPRGKKGIQAKN